MGTAVDFGTPVEPQGRLMCINLKDPQSKKMLVDFN
jgi:hypothetical protein